MCTHLWINVACMYAPVCMWTSEDVLKPVPRFHFIWEGSSLFCLPLPPSFLLYSPQLRKFNLNSLSLVCITRVLKWFFRLLRENSIKTIYRKVWVFFWRSLRISYSPFQKSEKKQLTLVYSVRGKWWRRRASCAGGVEATLENSLFCSICYLLLSFRDKPCFSGCFHHGSLNLTITVPS